MNKLFTYIILIVLLFLGINNYSKFDKSNIYTGRDSFLKSFLKLPEKSMVITSYLYFHYRYYQDIMGLRRDVTLLGYSDIFYPQFYGMISKDRFQNVKGISYDLDLTNTAKVANFINLNINHFDRMFTEAISEVKGMERFIKYYDGILFEFTRAKIDTLDSKEVMDMSNYFDAVISNFIYDYDYRNDTEASFIYIQDFVNIINYLLHYGYSDNVLYMTNVMQNLFGSGFRDELLSNDKNNLKVLAGVAYIKKLDFDKGEAIFKEMIDKNEQPAEAYNKLGFIYKYKKEYDKAANFYELAIKENPLIMENYVELGSIYEELGNPDKAHKVYTKGIKNLNQNEKAFLKSKMDKLSRSTP